jgi:hypothetical protein
MSFVTETVISVMATPTARQKRRFAQTAPVNKFLFSPLDRFASKVEALFPEVAVRG